MRKKRKQWWIYGSLGTVLLGSGLSIAIECGFIKHSDGDFWTWVLGGTAGIGMVLSGVVLLIRGGIIEYELNQAKKRNEQLD